MLSRGDVGLIFPEGGRSRSGRVDADAATYGVGRVVKALPGCRVLCVYLRGEGQTTYTDAPARGERFRVRFASLEPKTEHGGCAARSRSRSRSWPASRRSRRTGSMLGNDIVDLGDPETRPGARHPRFDARVFTREERAALAAARGSGAAALGPVGGQGSRLQVPEEARARDLLLAACASRCGSPRTRPGAWTRRAPPARGALRGGRRAARGRDGRRRSRARRAARGVGAAGRRRSATPRSQAVRALARDAAAARLGCEPGELEFSREGRVPRLRRRGAQPGPDLSFRTTGASSPRPLETPARAGAT